MARNVRWTRRQMMGTTAAFGMLGAKRALAAPALVKGSKLTFWGGLIFSDKANKLLVETIRKWGADNGIQAEVVMINQNETVQKVSAAVASNTMPDALDMGLDLLLLLSRQGQFLLIDDIYASVGKAQGGWYTAAAQATDTTKVAGGRTGLPFGITGNLLLRRNDVLAKAGFAKPPATWDELVAQSIAVNKPPFHALGLALSNVGDGNAQILPRGVRLDRSLRPRVVRHAYGQPIEHAPALCGKAESCRDPGRSGDGTRACAGTFRRGRPGVGWGG